MCHKQRSHSPFPKAQILAKHRNQEISKLYKLGHQEKERKGNSLTLRTGLKRRQLTGRRQHEGTHGCTGVEREKAVSSVAALSLGPNLEHTVKTSC